MKPLDIIYKMLKNPLKFGEKILVPQDPRNNKVISSLNFLFASYISNLELKKLAT